MKLTAQEEYGLRCLLQVARRAPTERHEPLSIRDVAEAEGLSVDYAAKLLRVLRQGGLVTSERGATGGYRLARPAGELGMREVMQALDTPLFGTEFCQTHSGQLGACVHGGNCAIQVLWSAVDRALAQVLDELTLADLMVTTPVAAPARAARAAEGA